jgi:foldase protein PrsA
MKKITLVVLILSLLITLFSGCQNGNANEVVANVGTESISIGELKYYIEAVKEQTIQNQAPEQLEAFWATEKDGKKPEEIIRDKALELYISLSVTAVKAKENNLTVTSAELDKYFKGKYDTKTLAETLSKYKISESALKNVTRKQMLTSKFNDRILKNNPKYIAIEERLKKVFAEKFLKAQHILKLTVGEDQKTPIPQDQKVQKKKEIDALLIKAKSGNNFSTLMSENTEDPGSEKEPEGYVFKEGDMVPEFYNAALSLKENEISDVVESSYGYHIIKRVPLDINKDYELNKSKLPTDDQQKASDDIQAIIDELKSTLKITLQDDKIKAIPVK